MIKNYIISAFRSLKGDRLYASINTIGLAIGLATGFLIFSWVKQELKYDQSYQGHDNIYRVTSGWDDSPDEGIASTYPMMKDKVLAKFPEIEETSRLYNTSLLGSKSRISIADKVFTDSKVFYGDTTFFSLFAFDLESGSKSHLFDLRNSVIITKRSAKKYFGNEDPLGKIILLNNSQELVVTGIMENIPNTTHFNFDILVSMQSHPWIKGAEDRLWSGIVFHTYIKIKPGSDVNQLETKINNYLDDFHNNPNPNLKISLQPVTDIHMKSHLRWELQPNGNINYIYLFITIALLVIVVACINYINLATARYTQRIKEVGIRKVLGAFRKQLIIQFMSESIIVAILALITSVLFIELGRSWMEQVTDQILPIEEFYSLQSTLLLVSVTLIVGLVSGFFPAIILSNFKAVQLFNPGSNNSPGGSSMRKGLVVFQFTISIILTTCTAITYRQLQFLETSSLGYNKEQVLILPINFDEVLPRYREFKSALLTNSDIISASATSQLPTNITEGENIDISESETRSVYYVSVDENFFETLDIEIIQGKERVNSIQPEKGINWFALNQSAVKEVGWDEQNTLGKSMSIRHGNMKPGQILGVISDFHFQSLHESIGPLVIEFDPSRYEYLLIRLVAGKETEAIDFVHAQWKEFAGTIPFDYSFLDQAYDHLYKVEKKVGTLFLVFASIASIIALLGLFGLASFAVEKRTKEIGVRKVLGANMTNIISLLVKDFSWMLLIALAIALPVSYYYMQEWLNTFAYRTTLTSYVFIIAGLVNIALALITLLYHGINASSNNPVNSLRSE